MIELASSLLNVGRDDDRLSPGFKPPAGVNLFGGMCVTSDETDATGRTLKVFNGDAALAADNSFPLGLVIENSNPFSRPASGDSSAGVGFDIQDFAKGELFSVFHRPGNFADVFDDQRDVAVTSRERNGAANVNQNASAPFIVGDAWAVGLPFYITADGLLTVSVSTGGGGGAGTQVLRGGYVRALAGTGPDLRLAVEWLPSVEIL